MKSSFGKLKRFVQKNDAKDRRDFPPPLNLHHLALASQEMQEMRNCYDSLLSAAAATTNSAYEFSESLREMGGCLQEKAELYKDEESKNIFMMLGKVQLDLQKLVDLYRSHIFLTITKPSESLLDELQTVQEMKQQCDEKRSVYEYMIAQQREKGRSKSAKGESFSSEQFLQAHSDYEDEATLCVFRLKSLKQGQSRSLLTQAARHHTAQLNFFRKGHMSLEAVDIHVKLIAEKQHIDYQLSGLDDGGDGEDEGEYSYDSNDNVELSFDYRPHKVGPEAAATSRNSMELDQEDQLFHKVSADNIESGLEKIHGDSQMLESEPRASNYSHSAPIIPEKRFDPAEKARQIRPSLTQKFHTYVLPTPDDAKSSNSSRTSSVPRTRPITVATHNIWFSSPLESKVNKRDAKEDNQPLSFYKAHPLDERDNSHDNKASSLLPLALSDGVAFRQSDSVDTSDHKKLKRQSFSGPLSSNSRSVKPGFSASGPIPSSKFPPRSSGPTSQVTLPQPSSPKTSRHSHPSVSPPKISELHELPRPPSVVSSKPTTSSASSGLSAPLGSKNSEFSVDNKGISTASNTAAPLPIPPLTVPRSFSIPSSHYRAKALNVTKLVESSQLQEKDVASPPLTPIALANAHAVLASPRAGTQATGT